MKEAGRTRLLEIRAGANPTQGVLLLRRRSALVWTIHPCPSFTFEMRRDTMPLFPPTLIAVFRRPARSLPKGRMETLFGIRMRGVALVVMIIDEGLVRPDIEALVLLE